MNTEELELLIVETSISPQQEYETFIKNVAGVGLINRDFVTSINQEDIFQSNLLSIELGTNFFGM